MKAIVMSLAILFTAASGFGQIGGDIPNPAIDMEGYLKLAGEAAKHRSTRRLTEEEFIRMSREPGTVILDARSTEKYNEMHVKGAVNLSFPDITVDSLATLFPDKNTRILIYCNNNFEGAEDPFPKKMATASLNISTYISLYTYGYRNVYELGPLVDIGATKLEMVASADTRD
ncbi:MAG: rhodanese-like domain-containing protein [Acidobacteriota bacterium]|nr:MAG: rhodanese-like domain-containing protein [Acidobacteriota bacterium]